MSTQDGGGSEQAAERLPGNCPENLELLEKLGKGSYGSVFKARVKKTGEIVAAKRIQLPRHNDEEGFKAVQREISTLQGCSHPNVVRYHASHKLGDHFLWIVMEYCAAGSVSDLIRVTDKPLAEDVIRFICFECLKGIQYLHNMSRIHRDIKCSNILLTEGGEVKLADFGVAAQLTTTMSKRNTFIGTPHWMAPEVIQESRYDGKVDMWALGISAIEMAEKFPPRWFVHPMRVLFMISREPAPQIEEPENWSKGFQDFVKRCLLQEPRVRPRADQLLSSHTFFKGDCDRRQDLSRLIGENLEALHALHAPLDKEVRDIKHDNSGTFSWNRDRRDGGEMDAINSTFVGSEYGDYGGTFVQVSDKDDEAQPPSGGYAAALAALATSEQQSASAPASGSRGKEEGESQTRSTGDEAAGAPTLGKEMESKLNLKSSRNSRELTLIDTSMILPEALLRERKSDANVSILDTALKIVGERTDERALVHKRHLDACQALGNLVLVHDFVSSRKPKTKMKTAGHSSRVWKNSEAIAAKIAGAVKHALGEE